MDKMDKYNVIEILRKELQKDIIENLSSSILRESLKDYESKIKPLIKDHVERVAIKSLDALDNVQLMRTDYKIYVDWAEEGSERTVTAEIKEGKVVKIEDSHFKACKTCSKSLISNLGIYHCQAKECSWEKRTCLNCYRFKKENCDEKGYCKELDRCNNHHLWTKA